jgi:hypothetical protein
LAAYFTPPSTVHVYGEGHGAPTDDAKLPTGQAAL